MWYLINITDDFYQDNEWQYTIESIRLVEADDSEAALAFARKINDKDNAIDSEGEVRVETTDIWVVDTFKQLENGRLVAANLVAAAGREM